MKKMFTLRGVANSGKTTKIKQIAQWVIDNYPVSIPHNIDVSKGDILGILQVNKLRIGFVSAGDDLEQVKRLEQLLSHGNGEDNSENSIDIIVNACRTRGAGRKYLQTNFNRKTGWLTTNIYVEKFAKTQITQQIVRDAALIDELKSWLTGLEKL